MLEFRNNRPVNASRPGTTDSASSVRPAEHADTKYNNRRKDERFQSLLRKVEQARTEQADSGDRVQLSSNRTFNRWYAPAALEQDLREDKPKSFEEAVRSYQKASDIESE